MFIASGHTAGECHNKSSMASLLLLSEEWPCFKRFLSTRGHKSSFWVQCFGKTNNEAKHLCKTRAAPAVVMHLLSRFGQGMLESVENMEWHLYAPFACYVFWATEEHCNTYISYMHVYIHRQKNIRVDQPWARISVHVNVHICNNLIRMQLLCWWYSVMCWDMLNMFASIVQCWFQTGWSSKKEHYLIIKRTCFHIL